MVGRVTSKSGFFAKVDIGSTEDVSLSLLAFEGATKRNRPNIEVGDTVFARVICPSRDVEPELVCITSGLKRDGMGILMTPNSHFSQMIQVSVHTARKLLSEECQLLKMLGEKYRFEISVGMNGWIWISSKIPDNLIFISNRIKLSESWRPEMETKFYDDLKGDHEFTLVKKKK